MNRRALMAWTVVCLVVVGLGLCRKAAEGIRREQRRARLAAFGGDGLRPYRDWLRANEERLTPVLANRQHPKYRGYTRGKLLLVTDRLMWPAGNQPEGAEFDWLDWVHPLHETLPPEFRAGAPNEVATLVVVEVPGYQGVEVQRGARLGPNTYEMKGLKARSGPSLLAVVDWRARRFVAATYVTDADAALAWLLGLPRQPAS